jgi:hypothetical protein
MSKIDLTKILTLSAAALSLTLVACGGDDDDGTKGGGGMGVSPGGSSSTGGSGGSTGGSGGGGEGLTYDECVALGNFYSAGECLDEAEAVAACQERSATTRPGTTVNDPSCGAGCTCNECTQEMIDCGEDPEAYCEVIVACANEVGCTGVACYSPSTCQEVIDDAPGGGLSSLSLALASAISDCAEAAGCSPSCE